MVAQEDIARPARGSVLIFSDDRDAAESMSSELRRRGFEVAVSTLAEDGIRRDLTSDVDAVLVDFRVPGPNGAELNARLVREHPDVPLIMVNNQPSYEASVAATRAGAWDVVQRPLSPEALTLAVDRAIRHRQLCAELTRLRRALRHSDHLDEVVGESPEFRQFWASLERAGESDATVLLMGESGTGKELAARALHQRSPRAQGPFITVNCAAWPEGQLERELFGQSSGTMFTDGGSARAGQFLRAEGGTLFLDEIGELPLGLQPKLLRAMQTRRVRPVGSDTELPFNVRILAASSQSLEILSRVGRFREELLYRLNVTSFELPPLRARGKDVLLLALRFIQQQAARTGKDVTALSPAAAERMLSWHWPGNVRELHNCIERAVTVATSEQIAVEDLPERIRNHRGWQVLTSNAPMDALVPIAELERRYILHVLEVVGGSRTLAAKTLGMDRKTLYRRLEQYGVPPEHSRRNEHARTVDLNVRRDTPTSSGG
ncbi:MAG: sigma-54 dependent transcriptional regulator [Myxococcaceae bacterium]